MTNIPRKLLIVDNWRNETNDEIYKIIRAAGVAVKNCRPKAGYLLILSWRPDAVLVRGVSHWSCLFWTLLVVSKFRHVPIYNFQDTSCVESSEPAFWKLRRLKSFLYGFVYGFFDGIMVPSSKAKIFFEQLGIDAKKIAVTPIPILTRHWNLENLPQINILLSKYGVSENDIVIVSVARLEHCKAHDILLKAVARISDARVKLIICGGGKHRENLSKLSQSLGIEKKVIFLGQCVHATVMEIHAIADIFVLASRREAAGAAVCEAMLNEIPVIVSSAVGLKNDIIVENFTGISFLSEDDLDLSRKISMLIGDPAFARNLGIRGRKKILEFADPDNHAKSLLSLLSWQ